MGVGPSDMGPDAPPYYQPYYDARHEFQDRLLTGWSIIKEQHHKKTSKSCNTYCLMSLHIVFIIGVICDIIISSMYASPFPLFSTEINENNVLGFMGNIAYIFMYILTFVSFIGLSICTLHCLCMICWDACSEYHILAPCHCEHLLDTAFCFGYILLKDCFRVFLVLSLFFILFCTSPALMLYAGVIVWSICNPWSSTSYARLYKYSNTYVRKAQELHNTMQELNPTNDAIKSVFMIALLHAFYAKKQNDVDTHIERCHNIIMYEFNHDANVSIDVLLNIYETESELQSVCAMYSSTRACLMSWCGCWILLYLVIVSVLFLCFGYSEDNDITFLWIYYMISYAVYLCLFLLIVPLQYMDGYSRFYTHFKWSANINLGSVKDTSYFGKTMQLWHAVDKYKVIKDVLKQQWLVNIIMEYMEIGDDKMWCKNILKKQLNVIKPNRDRVVHI